MQRVTVHHAARQVPLPSCSKSLVMLEILLRLVVHDLAPLHELILNLDAHPLGIEKVRRHVTHRVSFVVPSISLVPWLLLIHGTMRDMHIVLICVPFIRTFHANKVVSDVWRLKIMLGAVICIAQLWLVQSKLGLRHLPKVLFF